MEPTARKGGGEGGIWRRSRMNRFMCTQMWGIYVLSLSPRSDSAQAHHYIRRWYLNVHEY